MKRNSQNFLDYIPQRNPNFSWSEGEDGLVVVDMVHTGPAAAIAQKLFHRPRVSHIQLDEYGSFLWRAMDGKTDIAALGKLLEAQFGDKAQPLYERLVKYMKILYNNRFVRFQTKV